MGVLLANQDRLRVTQENWCTCNRCSQHFCYIMISIGEIKRNQPNKLGLRKRGWGCITGMQWRNVCAPETVRHIVSDRIDTKGVWWLATQGISFSAVCSAGETVEVLLARQNRVKEITCWLQSGFKNLLCDMKGSSVGTVGMQIPNPYFWSSMALKYVFDLKSE